MHLDIDEALRTLSPEIAVEVQRFVKAARKPLAPGEPRRHHFVPQFYLRRFADNAERVAVVRLADPARPTVTHVRNAAVIKGFYTVVDEAGDDTAAVEKLLALVEDAAKPAVERLVHGVLFPPPDQDRLQVALWLALQYVRDPQSRRRAEALADAAVKLQASLIPDERARDHLRDLHGREPTDEEVTDLVDGVHQFGWEAVPSQNELVQLMLDSAMRIAPYFYERSWCVIQFPSPGFVTCDRPLVLYQHPENRSPYQSFGIATADEITVALDRRTLLVMHTDQEIGDMVLPAAPEQTVGDYNRMLVHNAHQEIYCHPDDVAAVQALDLPSADRPLVTMQGGGWGDRPLPDGVNTPPKRKHARRYAQARNLERTD